MEAQLTIEWLEKVIAKTKQLLIEETADGSVRSPYGISLGGKLRAYIDCLEFIKAHQTKPAVKELIDNSTII